MKLDAKLQWWVSKGSFSKRFGSLVHSFFTQGRKNSSIPATTTTTTPPAAATTTAESCNCCCYCHCYGYCYCSCSCCFLLLLLLLLLLILLLLLLCCDPCCPNCLLERHSHCHDYRRLTIFNWTLCEQAQHLAGKGRRLQLSQQLQLRRRLLLLLVQHLILLIATTPATTTTHVDWRSMPIVYCYLLF